MCWLLQTREYFIAAEEVVWDYAPFNGEMCGGTLVPFSDNAKTFVEAGPDKIGRKYVKALFVEYTDATFKEKKVRGGLGFGGCRPCNVSWGCAMGLEALLGLGCGHCGFDTTAQPATACSLH